MAPSSRRNPARVKFLPLRILPALLGVWLAGGDIGRLAAAEPAPLSAAEADEVSRDLARVRALAAELAEAIREEIGAA